MKNLLIPYNLYLVEYKNGDYIEGIFTEIDENNVATFIDVDFRKGLKYDHISEIKINMLDKKLDEITDAKGTVYRYN